MGKRSVARRDPYRCHDISLALGKARAAVALADVLSNGEDYIQLPNDGQPKEDTLSWLRMIAFDAIRESLDEAEAGFRQSLTPEQALAQFVGPQTVA